MVSYLRYLTYTRNRTTNVSSDSGGGYVGPNRQPRVPNKTAPKSQHFQEQRAAPSKQYGTAAALLGWTAAATVGHLLSYKGASTTLFQGGIVGDPLGMTLQVAARGYVGRWVLDVGCWKLDVGRWWLVVGVEVILPNLGP